MANHTWGECYSNAANKKPKSNGAKTKKRHEKSNKDEVDGHAAHLANNEMLIMSSTTAHGTHTTSEPRCQQAVNDNLSVLAINNGMFAQLCIDLNKQVDDPNALVAKFKAACAATATSAEVNNGTYTYNGFISTITHHLHDLSLTLLCAVRSQVYMFNIVMKFTLMESQILELSRTSKMRCQKALRPSVRP
jgi:hypothetical protein